MPEAGTIPEDVRQAVDGVHPGAKVRVLGFSDLATDGKFGERWVALAGENVLVFTSNGADAELLTDLPLKDVSKVEVERLVGGSALRAVVKGVRVDLLSFSNALSEHFGRVRAQLDAAAKGKPIPEVEERTRYCETCGLVLGEHTRVCPRCLRRGATLRRLVGYGVPYKGRLILSVVLLLGATLTEIAPPLIMKYLMDLVFVPMANYHLLLPLVGGLAGVSIVRTGLQIWRNRLSAWIGARISFDIRAILYERLQWLSMRYYDRHPTGAIISRLTRDSEGIQDMLSFALPMVVANTLMMIAVSIAMFVINWRLALLALVPLPLFSALIRSLWRTLRRAFHNFWYRWSRYHTLVSDALARVKMTKAFSQQPGEIDRYQIRNDDLRSAITFAEQTAGTMFPLMWLVIGSGSLLIWYFGGRYQLQWNLSVGDIMAFLSYVMMIQMPLNFTVQLVQWVTRALTAAERVFEVLDADTDSEQTRGEVELEEIRGDVEFRNVNFGYEKHQQVLKDISFKVGRGEMLGLVGKSGVGKSTIINLLCRFYDADEGEVLVDGINLRDIALQSYRGRLGAVLQDPFLFSGTIAENIAYGKPAATAEEIMAAAKMANAHEFIIAKPDGYDEQAGERGSRLSGGEKQRICIARAILHDPAILILDEATANVDLETEEQIQEAIARLIAGRTTFAIAHRLSTLRNAQKLIVLDEGRIVESGTHEELAAKKGLYAELLDMHRKTSMVEAVRG